MSLGFAASRAMFLQRRSVWRRRNGQAQQQAGGATPSAAAAEWDEERIARAISASLADGPRAPITHDGSTPQYSLAGHSPARRSTLSLSR